MKLRVREGKVTHKIEVPSGVTYVQLKDKVATVLRSDPSGVRLSLNKQAELAGGQDKLVRAEGVKGGDLLWLLSPSESQSSSWEQATCTQPVPEHEAKHQRLSECPGNVAKDQPLSSGDAPSHEADIMREKANGHSSIEEPMEEIGNASQSAELPQDRPALSLSDSFALVKEANSNGGHLLLCALHATLLEAGWAPAWSIQADSNDSAEALQLPAASGKIARLKYEYTSRSGSAVCEIVASLLGSFLMISAKLPEGKPHSLSLDGRQYLETKDLTGLSKLQSVSKERDLLIQISNGLLRPLMVDLRSILGLSPPAGILSLPLDLADKILGKLSVEDLVSLMGTCKELRGLAATDLLWERLTTAEFNLDEEDVMLAQRSGWLQLYKKRHLSREAARQRIRQMQERSRRPHPFLQPGPFRRPTGPYHQIGGDYDRNPIFQGPTWRPFLGSSRGQGGSWNFRGSGI